MATDTQDILFGYMEASMDQKTGRFSIPLNLFAKMGNDTHLRMTVDPLGRFLELRSDKKFKDLVDRITAAAADLPPETAAALMTEYLAFSTEVQVDNILRLVVPKMMRGPLADDSDLALVAVGDALRVWSLRKFRESEAERREPLKRDYAKFVNLTLGLPIGRPPVPAPEPHG